MLRELAVTLYLVIFSIIFKISKWFPLQNKVTFVVSFSENNKSIYKEMLRQDLSCRTLFLTTEKMYSSFSKYEEASTLLFELKKPLDFICSIYHLATSKVVFVDNYYGFLDKSNFKPTVECIQLWHANGAIKKFGLKDPSIESRSKKALKRFKSVYNRFSKVIVGSEAMADIFRQAFEVTEDRILRTGIPRTDVFFDPKTQLHAQTKLYRKYPFLENKKVLLYAPTFRENQLTDAEMKLDLKSMAEQFEDQYVLLLKFHPAVKNNINIPSELSHFVYDFSDYHQLNELLFITDTLITDYSSIPFEYSLLNRQIVFFLYDLEAYEEERGIWENFIKFLPGPIAYSSDQVSTLIQDGNFDEEKVRSFSSKWNEYSNGDSSKNVLEIVKNKLTQPY
jgi:teichoic acid glycerol-phosphate primase